MNEFDKINEAAEKALESIFNDLFVNKTFEKLKTIEKGFDEFKMQSNTLLNNSEELQHEIKYYYETFSEQKEQTEQDLSQLKNDLLVIINYINQRPSEWLNLRSEISNGLGEFGQTLISLNKSIVNSEQSLIKVLGDIKQVNLSQSELSNLIKELNIQIIKQDDDIVNLTSIFNNKFDSLTHSIEQIGEKLIFVYEKTEEASKKFNKIEQTQKLLLILSFALIILFSVQFISRLF